MTSDIINVASRLHNFVINADGDGDGDFEIVTRVSDEGEQSETILGVPKGLRYRPSNFEITSVQGNSIRRMRIVDDIREADLRRPVENIERNAAAGS
jgi:hypothetical protein